MDKKQIVLLAGDRDTTPIVFNFLAEHFEVVKVIVEKPVSRLKLFIYRCKRFGLVSGVGQGMFVVVLEPLLRREAKQRIMQIKNENSLSEKEVPETLLTSVPSVNSEEARAILAGVRAAIVVVHGTRIIGKKTLSSTNATFLNIHAGITPKYRGGCGAYWALALGDSKRCGVTVHIVDEGVDTGAIVSQGIISPEGSDNFSSYAWLQLSLGLYLLKTVIENINEQKMPKKMPNNSDIVSSDESLHLQHPTIWGYIGKRIRDDIK